MKPITPLLAILFSIAGASAASAEPAATAQLRPSNVARTITPIAGGKYRVGITFTPGAHANDRVITNYFDLVRNSANVRLAFGEARHKDICTATTCTLSNVWTANTLIEAQTIKLRVGYFSPVQVRWTAGTPPAAACEAESCDDCYCNGCSCAGIVARVGTLSSEVSAVLNWANQEHYHTGYHVEVP